MNDSVDDLEGTWVVISVASEGSSGHSDPQVTTELTLRGRGVRPDRLRRTPHRIL